MQLLSDKMIERLTIMNMNIDVIVTFVTFNVTIVTNLQSYG